jgi:tRNA (adenine37-N6)-methyltransferase
MEIIAHIRNGYREKFGVPRQSGLVPAVSRVVMEPEYSVREAFRGIEDFSHLWLLWEFDHAAREQWRPTVRPPRLGGNTRMGVFATRSPYRPNKIGLTVVKLLKVAEEDGRVVLHVTGADMMDGTPVIDIKPYVPYADSVPDARGSFAEEKKAHALQVILPEELRVRIPQEDLPAVLEILAQDPRPAYQHQPERVYGVPYGENDIRFMVDKDTLTVTDVVPYEKITNRKDET